MSALLSDLSFQVLTGREPSDVTEEALAGGRSILNADALVVFEPAVRGEGSWLRADAAVPDWPQGVRLAAPSVETLGFGDAEAEPLPLDGPGGALLGKHGVEAGIAARLFPGRSDSSLLCALRFRLEPFEPPELAELPKLARFLGQLLRLRGPQIEAARPILRRCLLEGKPSSLWVTDTKLRVVLAIPFGETAFDPYTRFVGSTLFEFFDRDDPNHPPIEAHLAALHDRRTSELLSDFPETASRLRVTALRDAEGRIVGSVGEAWDGSLPEAQTGLLAEAIASAANAVLVTDREGSTCWVNPAFTRLTGYTYEEVAGKNPRILKSDANDPEIYERLWKTILAGRPWRGEMVNQRKNGTLYTEMQTITPVKDECGGITHFVSIKEDITEQKALEEQFRQAQRMEAVGRLAGWVAHDFNNLLTAILGYTDLMLSDVEEGDPRRADLDAVKNAAERATSLTRQLLTFSRRQVVEPRTLDLNGVVRSIEKMLGRLIGEDIELSAKLTEPLGAIRGDPGQIEQVLLNLAVNARDAMADGGRLTIETHNVELDADYELRHTVVEPGPYVMVAVSDTGPGIEAETLAHIFEPFFTTKEKGHGSGLGLSTVYGIVKQSGGYIWAYSEMGIGTTFKVYFPRTETAVETVAPPSKQSDGRRGDETVLLVEDEDSVRQLACRVLSENGYNVLEARNGAEALHISNEHKGTIDLMLTDVIMPLMSGPEVARRQKTLRPEMRVLFMSGYTDEAIARHGLVGQAMPLLQKPFAPVALLERVRACLEGLSGPVASPA